MIRAPRWAYPLMSAAALLAACAGCGSSAAGGAADPGGTANSGGTAAAPVLGRVGGDFAHGRGFGTVKPTLVDNGGDPTGLVTHIRWKSWGGGKAIGTGTSTWVGPSQAVAEGRPAAVTIEAFRLGMCH